MSKEFIPYKEAFAMKELGFDEICFGQYDNRSEYKFTGQKFKNSDTRNSVICALPLYQQAFRWFRDKYDEHHTWRLQTILSVEDYETYEEAELACLKKLIEIVNQNKEDET